MARDPRKNSAFASGLRGREKPAVSGAHGGTFGQESAGTTAGGESKQGPSTTVGNPDGVKLNDSAYSSGMRGMEKGNQKSASGDATKHVGGSSGGESKQGPNTVVGQPKGHDDAGSGPRKGVNDSHLRQTPSDAHALGAAGSANSTENAAMNKAPIGDAGILGDEDDTHINLRIPKASLKKKASGVNAG